jgi:DNA-directed RNA polymerase specialized sigma24 family protein
VLGITEAAASVRLHRAREVLKARMSAKEVV